MLECALSRARREKCAFPLTKTYMEVGKPEADNPAP
jgi:hypothetical protein